MDKDATAPAPKIVHMEMEAVYSARAWQYVRNESLESMLPRVGTSSFSKVDALYKFPCRCISVIPGKSSLSVCENNCVENNTINPSNKIIFIFLLLPLSIRQSAFEGL